MPRVGSSKKGPCPNSGSSKKAPCAKAGSSKRHPVQRHIPSTPEYGSAPPPCENMLFSQYSQVHTQTNFGAVITIDKLILHVYMPHWGLRKYTYPAEPNYKISVIYTLVVISSKYCFTLLSAQSWQYRERRKGINALLLSNSFKGSL